MAIPKKYLKRHLVKPLPTVDVLVEKQGKILLLRRAIPPFVGRWVLPGGKVDYGETVEQAAAREAREETGLVVRLREILGVYSSPKRDPRAHTISIAFVGSPKGGRLKSSRESTELQWFAPQTAAKLLLGFDHAKILADYLKWRRRKRGTFWSSR